MALPAAGMMPTTVPSTAYNSACTPRRSVSWNPCSSPRREAKPEDTVSTFKTALLRPDSS